jgi:phage tail-like protein
VRREHIERLLPAGYQRASSPGSALSALLAVMESMHAPSEATLARVEDLVAPYRAPERLVPFLLRWVAWDHLPTGADQASVPVGRLRDVLASAATLSSRRGTAAGLTALLTTVCGVPGFVIDEPAGRPFHLVVRVPPPAAPRLDLIGRLVAAEKPAATTCEITLIGDSGPDRPTHDTDTNQPEDRGGVPSWQRNG